MIQLPSLRRLLEDRAEAMPCTTGSQDAAASRCLFFYVPPSTPGKKVCTRSLRFSYLWPNSHQDFMGLENRYNRVTWLDQSQDAGLALKEGLTDPCRCTGTCMYAKMHTHRQTHTETQTRPMAVATH